MSFSQSSRKKDSDRKEYLESSFAFWFVEWQKTVLNMYDQALTEQLPVRTPPLRYCTLTLVSWMKQHCIMGADPCVVTPSALQWIPVSVCICSELL